MRNQIYKCYAVSATTLRHRKSVVLRVRYLRRWNNEGKTPVPIYHFYPKGKAEDKGYTLSEGLKRFPESEYKWVEIKE